MDSENNKSQLENTEKLKEIPKWTLRYAQNRTLTLLVLMVMILLFSMVISFPLGLGMTAFKKGNIILGSICIAVEVGVWIMLIIFISKFGGKNRGRLDRLIDQRIYGSEGAVSLEKSKSSKKKIGIEIVAAMVWFCLFFLTLHLANKHVIPIKYVLPVSALFSIPYMICGWYFWQSPKMGPIFLLQPILYAIHAILILAGVPLFFTGSIGPSLNLTLPYIVYGLLPFVVGHVYSRHALKKLKDAAYIEKQASDEA